MPAVRGLTASQKIIANRKNTARKCKDLMYEHNISFTEVANILEITPQAVSSQFKNKKLTLDVISAVLLLAKETDQAAGHLINL